ncbi:PDZ domain-containing protein [Candidatus Dependentiae bacterium]|nr:PDZ domain-containing protein [Candidatus Dependentiae bacterium]
MLKLNKLLVLLIITFINIANAKNNNSNRKFRHPLLAKKDQVKLSLGKNNNSTDHKKEIYPWLGTFAEVISLIEKKAFREVDFSNFVQEALKAAVPHVDAHSAFFSKKSYQETMESTSGKFSGIGVSIISKAPEDDTLLIVDVIQSGPAYKAGLKGGDKIIEVDGEKLRGLSTDEVINKLKGKNGTIVQLKIIREKKPLEFKIKREIIKDPTSFCYHFPDQNIYYISLKIFNQPAAKQVSELLKKANKGKAKGLIIDLRRNPGGILNSAIDMAELFLPKKSLVVTTKNKFGEITSQYYTRRKATLSSNIPIFILVDNFSASASEILAGCLQYYSKKLIDPKTKKSKLMVFLVGTSTFGKGSVQEVIPISNGCALKLTVDLYYLPNDVSIQAKGIDPDFLVKPKMIPSEEMQWVQDLYGKEQSLKHHISEEEVKTGIKEETKKEKEEETKEKTWEEKQKEAINKDTQIKASLNLINLLDFARKCNPNIVNTRAKALNFLKRNFITDEAINIEKVK